VLAPLDIPDPFDAKEMCRLAGVKRGRPILVAPMNLGPAAPCGLWLEAKDADFIFVEADTSGAHQDHIILHELGHVLCHAHSDTLDANTLRELFPALDLELVRGALGRSRYSTTEEREAEIFAHVVLDRVWQSASPPVAKNPHDSYIRDILHRFASGIEG
jgi:hypothetical protein